MPRPTRTRRMRGAPTAEAPHPTRKSPVPVEKAAASSGVSSRLGSISSDIYGATPPPVVDPKPNETQDAEPELATTETKTQRSTRSSVGNANLQLEVQQRSHPRRQFQAGTRSTAQQNEPPSVRRGRTSRRDTSGVDLNDKVFDDLDSDLGDLDVDLDIDDTELDSEQVAVSANTSTISVSQFKRRGRSRKPSFAGSTSGLIRPSSRGAGNSSTIASTFNIGLFRRRAREPSILGANRRRANSVATDNSDVGTDVGTDMECDNGDPVADDDAEDMADFKPDAISTPLNKRRSTRHQSPSILASATRPSTVPQKRKSSGSHLGNLQAEKAPRLEDESGVGPEDELEESIEKETTPTLDVQEKLEVEVEVPASAPLPEASPEIEVPASHPPPTIAESSAPIQAIAESSAPIAPMEVDANDDSLSDITSDEESLPSPLAPHRTTAARPTTPVYNETDMAPPMSSSSDTGSPVAWPPIRDVARRRRIAAPTTPIRAREGFHGHVDSGGSSPLSSPPSLTHSPNYAPTRQAKGKSRHTHKPPPPKVLTAELQTLLPQRRTRTQHSNVHEPEPNNDEDELSRPARRKGTGRPPSRSNAASSGPTPTTPAPAAPVTTLAQRKRMQFEPSRRISRTYGTRNAHTSVPHGDGEEDVVSIPDGEAHAEYEGENAERSTFQPLPDDTFTQDDATSSGSTSNGKSSELKQAVKKFKEVDRWEMEFEEVTEPESPPNAR
ncbi:ATP-dependent RNA helicase mrh-4 mitochondrial [Ceratocystis lukuohia]|uniref:ATP-dependent RNA helicase mrh-4 mitochondrial n=1 Tax=Ceratocystis lukuohia TaxID=2019550 RepID=A0ABR4ME36_9PEZI